MMMVVPRFHQQRSIFPLQSSNIHNDDVDVDDDDDDELNTDTSIISSLDSSSADPLIDEADFEDFRCGFVSIIGAPNMVRASQKVFILLVLYVRSYSFSPVSLFLDREKVPY